MTLPWWLTMYGDACRKNSTNLSGPMPSMAPGGWVLPSSHETFACGSRVGRDGWSGRVRMQLQSRFMADAGGLGAEGADTAV